MAAEKSFGELLIEGLEEAVAHDRGELPNVSIRRVARTARDTEVAPPPRYNAQRIVQIRKQLNVSQPVFASMLNVATSTVRAWEPGAREPEGPTRRLLEVAEYHPESLARGLGYTGAPEGVTGKRAASKGRGGTWDGKAVRSGEAKPKRK